MACGKALTYLRSTARLDLAGTLKAQGDLGALAAHQEPVLEAMRRLLGDEHPDTL
jgi:hypothetical protein